MKKTLCLLFAAFSLLALSACGRQKTVSDQIIQWEIEDFLLQYDNGYTDYQPSIIHSPDKDNNTDTVTVGLTVSYPHYTSATSFQATYQYDKSRDLWEKIRSRGWEPPRVLTYSIPFSSTSWQKALESLDFECELYEGDEFLLSTSTKESIKKSASGGWRILGFCDDDNYEHYRFADIQCIQFAPETDARTLVKYADIPQNRNGFCERDHKEGDNYEYCVFSYPFDVDYETKGTAITTCIWVDNTYLYVCAQYEEEYKAEHDIKSLFNKLGFSLNG